MKKILMIAGPNGAGKTTMALELISEQTMVYEFMEDDVNEMILRAHARSFKRAFEIAVRTGTALVFARNGKIVEVKPPYRYELVPIKRVSKKKSNPKSRKKKPFT